jgi:F0F1-type ATP synthase B chain
MFMLDEEYVKREKRAAKGYKEYLAKRPEFKKEMEKLRHSWLNNEITPEEFRKRALEIGKKYR